MRTSLRDVRTLFVAALIATSPVVVWSQDKGTPPDGTVSKPVEPAAGTPPSPAAPAEKPAANADDKAVEKPTDKPTEKPAEKPSEKPVDKPAEKAVDKPTEEAGSKSGVKGKESQPPQDRKGKDDKEAKADTSEAKRLESIEKQLSEMMKLMQEMKQGQASTSGPTGAKASTEPAAAEAKPARPKLVGDIPENWIKGVRWRSIGPANMGGRIVDMTMHPTDTSTWWVATASGGLLKTVNNGVSFQHQFDKEKVVSIGAVAVAPSNPNILWVGTGENNPRNSVSYGNGVYKSVDGGKSWKHMGLDKTFQIGEVLVHPTDANIVYVGALGRLYGPNEERGVYKTVDGGETWTRCFYLDDRTGVIDMQMHPTDPNTLIIAAWERMRDGFDSWPGTEVPIPDGYDGYDPIRKWGPSSGLYKTVDGGQNWKRLTKGLPTGQMGRIGIDWYRKDPSILYAVIDSENIGKGPEELPVYWGAVGVDQEQRAYVQQVAPRSPAAVAGLKVGDRIVSVEGKEIQGFDQVLDVLRGKKRGDSLAVVVERGTDSMPMEFKLTSRPSSRGGNAQLTGWLGWNGGESEGQVVITQVLPVGPANAAGIQANDVVLEADGKVVTEYEQVSDLVSSKAIGEKIKFKIRHDDAVKEIELTVEERQNPFGGGGGGGGGPGGPGQASPVIVGLQGQDVEGVGIKLTEVTADGPAAKAGLMAGDILKSVNERSLEAYRDLTRLLRDGKPGDVWKFAIVRGAETKVLEVTLIKRPPPSRPYTASLGGQAPNIQDQQGAKGFEYGGIYKSTDGGESWVRVNSLHARPMYFSVVRVDPSNEQNVYLLGVSQYKSSDGGVTFDANLGRSVHADGHALWIDPRDGRHMVIGCDGGVYTTYDRGVTWDHLNLNAVGQFYHVAISPKYPYYVYGGLQDNGSWGGPAISLNANGPINEDWLSVGGGDGFTCRVDQNDPDLVYWTSQNGAIGRRHMKTGERASIRPATVPGQPAYRFNWNAPFILSNFNSRIFYCGGNYVFRSFDRGNNLEVISPEITLTKRGSATAISESPRNPSVLYAGTDDGALWVTTDGGKNWSEVGKNLKLAAPRWVSTIEASRFADGRVYVCLDGHRSNDDDPYVFVSEDFGKTWTSTRSDLPWGSSRCLREDLVNENLLFVGTEFGLMVSTDRGGHWNSLNTNLPSAPVFDLAFHPNNGEIVAATHGRSLWACNVAVLRQLSVAHVMDSAALYEPSSVIRWRREASRGSTNRAFTGSNPTNGAQIFYALPAKAEKVELKIVNVAGETVREWTPDKEAGLHSVTWDLQQVQTRRGPGGFGAPGGFGGGGFGPGGRGGAGGGGPAAGAGGATRESAAGGQPPAGAGEAPAGDERRGRRGRGGPPAAGGEGVPATPGAPAAATEGAPAQEPATETGEGAQRGAGGQRGQMTPEMMAQMAAGGFGGRGGARRQVPAGSYKLVLVVDGKEFVQQLRVVNDPNLSVAESLALEERMMHEEATFAEDEQEDGTPEPEHLEADERIRRGKDWIDQ